MKLSAVMELEQEIKFTRNRLLLLRQMATNITPIIDGLPRKSSVSSKIENAAVQIVDAQRRLDELADEYATTTIELSEKIYQRVKGGKMREILFQRYVLCKSFAEIAADMNYDTTHIYRLHKRGKQEYERTDTDDKNQN